MSSMGGCNSAEVRFEDKKQDNGPHAATTEAQPAKKPKEKAAQGAIFSGLALKFPLVRKAFSNVKNAFHSYVQDGKEGGDITVNKLGAVMGALGAKDLSESEIQQYFSLSDLDHSKAISFREFLIAISLGYYLKDNIPEEKRGPHFEENRKGFKVIENAFRKIDKDNSGSVNTEELKEALFDVATSDNSREILEARFKELDFNDSGDIDFPEFIYGFTSWVGMTGEEEDDDDEEQQDQATEANTNANTRIQSSEE